MTALKAHEVERFLKRPDLDAGIFLAYGPDTGLVRETAQRLVRHYAGSSIDGMGLVTLDGGELNGDPGRLLVEARTGSLFGERRVIRIRDAGKALTVPLAELSDDPSGAVVILEAGNLAPRDPLRALVEASRNGRALPCYADSDETILRLINETFAAAGIRAEPDVAPTLRDTLGNDREVTRRELEKLSLYAAESKLLTREDVRVLTDAVKQSNPAAVDELVPALLGLSDVQRVLQALLAERIPINDLSRIYEGLAGRAKVSTEPEGLIEAARAEHAVLRAKLPGAVRQVAAGGPNLISGTPEQIAEQVQGLHEGGIQHLLTRFLGEWHGETRPIAERSMRLFAEQVIPRFAHSLAHE